MPSVPAALTPSRCRRLAPWMVCGSWQFRQANSATVWLPSKSYPEFTFAGSLLTHGYLLRITGAIAWVLSIHRGLSWQKRQRICWFWLFLAGSGLLVSLWNQFARRNLG